MIPIASPAIGRREQRAVGDVLASGSLAGGERVREFETAFATFADCDHGVATSNGTTALHAAMHGLGLGPGDRVVTTPFSFVATANAVRLCGAEPVFADIDPATYNLDPNAVESLAREGELAAILAVHLYGLPADAARLREIADDHDLLLVEDAAQAHGAEIEGRRVGSFGDAACFSFYPTKNMTTGEGGMVTTDRADVAEAVRSFVDHGRTSAGSYEHASLGHNFRLTDAAAAIGLVQLERLPGFTRARRANARRLSERLAEAPISLPTEPEGYRHVYHQYTIRVADRDGVRTALAERGVDSKVYYPVPIHRQPAYAGWTADAPEADAAAAAVLSLPVHPGVSRTDVETIAAALEASLAVRQ